MTGSNDERLQDTLPNRIWALASYGSAGISVLKEAKPDKCSFASEDDAIVAVAWVRMWMGQPPAKGSTPKIYGRYRPHERDVVISEERAQDSHFVYELDAALCYAFHEYFKGGVTADTDALIRRLWEANAYRDGREVAATPSTGPTEAARGLDGAPEYFPGPVWVPEARGTSGLEWL